MTRAELVADDLNHFIKIHKPYANFKTAREDIMFMGEVASVGGTSLANHHMLFSGTLAGIFTFLTNSIAQNISL